MARKPRKDQFTAITVGQHVAFSAAVQLASSELLEDPHSAGTDPQRAGVLNVIADALMRVVPVYFQESGVARRRALSDSELMGAQVMHQASVLVLKDGRSLSAVSIKRRDLERGITVLRSVGIPELRKAPGRKPASRAAELSAEVAEMRELVRPPLLPSQLERVNVLALSIARRAPNATIADLAIRLLSALHDARAAGERADSRGIELLVARMRDAIGK